MIRYPLAAASSAAAQQHVPGPGQIARRDQRPGPSQLLFGRANRNGGRRSNSITAAAAAAASPRLASAVRESGQHEPARTDDVVRVTSSQGFTEPAPGRLDLPRQQRAPAQLVAEPHRGCRAAPSPVSPRTRRWPAPRRRRAPAFGEGVDLVARCARPGPGWRSGPGARTARRRRDPAARPRRAPTGRDERRHLGEARSARARRFDVGDVGSRTARPSSGRPEYVRSIASLRSSSRAGGSPSGSRRDPVDLERLVGAEQPPHQVAGADLDDVDEERVVVGRRRLGGRGQHLVGLVDRPSSCSASPSSKPTSGVMPWRSAARASRSTWVKSWP